MLQQRRLNDEKKDHPRRCGENFYKVGFAAYDTGSPPQVRGKQLNLVKAAHWNGITPAGAGKTRLCGGLSARPEDHPRRCGENKICYSKGG